MTGITKRVVIPKFIEETNPKYFIPRFVKIQKGETIEWTNLDIKRHALVFYRISHDLPEFITKLESIEPNESKQMMFPYDFERIDYYCNMHPTERGSVIIFPKDEDAMTNSEQLKFLSRIFDINPPKVYNHLKSQP